MEITVNLYPNFPGVVHFHVTFKREIPGYIDIVGDLQDNDEPLSVLRQKAEAQAKTILKAFAAAIN